jgi:hypothetical protein
MKAKLLILVLLLSPFAFRLSPCYAQVPQGFNYQAIARDGSGIALANQALPVKIAIQTSLTGGTLIYEELFSSVTSNQFGLISLVVGTGIQTGGSAASFSAIDWKAQTLFLKTTIQYPGTTWTTMGASQIWGVPYSLVAKEVAGPLSKLGITGTTDVMDEALFEVKNKAGNTVFAVYNEGIRAYVGNGKAKGIKGGFSVGGYDATKGSTIYDLFTLSTDSARLYFDSKPTGKGIKGGFSVGGYDMTKGGIPVQDYLTVNKDSVRIYIDSNPATKALRGGFAVGGFAGTEGLVDNFISLTPENYFIGHKAGHKNTTGKNNSVMGYESASNNTEGYDNVFIGYHSGYSNTLGRENIFIGTEAGHSNIGEIQTIPWLTEYGCYNIFIGQYAGFSNVSGFANLFLGNISGYSNISGIDNTFVGNLSGWENTNGWGNTYLGKSSGRSNVSGKQNVNVGLYSGNKNISDANTFIGAYSGQDNILGGYNTMVGTGAGSNSTGSFNVFIGNGAGYDESGSNKLYIENSGSAIPLIGGDFTGDRVGINRMPTTYTLEVGGTIWANGSAIVAGSTTWSDARYKKDVKPLTDALSDVLKIHGVKYNWRQSEFPELNFTKGVQIGIIAQDLEKVLPELVYTSPNGYKSVSYEKLTPVLVEAIKEQQQQIESYKSQLQALQEKVDKIEDLLVKALVE